MRNTGHESEHEHLIKMASAEISAKLADFEKRGRAVEVEGVTVFESPRYRLTLNWSYAKKQPDCPPDVQAG
jgi:hypothetical protein